VAWAELKLSVLSMPAATVVVLATHPCSAGVSFARHFTILGVLPAAEAGDSNIADLFVARYGKPVASTRIFIRTRQVRNDWADTPPGDHRPLGFPISAQDLDPGTAPLTPLTYIGTPS
jgi:hypothetical protein